MVRIWIWNTAPNFFATAVQIDAVGRMLPGWLESASEIKGKWWRIGAYIGIIAGAMVYTLGCIALPKLEDAFAARRRAR